MSNTTNIVKERDAIDPTENRSRLSPQRESQSRTAAALLPAPGENSGTPDTRADPQGPCASAVYPCRNAGKFSDCAGRTHQRSGDGAAENCVPSAGSCAGSCKDDSRPARKPQRSAPFRIKGAIIHLVVTCCVSFASVQKAQMLIHSAVPPLPHKIIFDAFPGTPLCEIAVLQTAR